MPISALPYGVNTPSPLLTGAADQALVELIAGAAALGRSAQRESAVGMEMNLTPFV